MKSSTEKKTEIITKDTLISEILEKYPEAAEILIGYGLMCVGCPAAAIETIEQGALGHGLTKKSVKMILKDLNKIIKNENKQ